MSVPVALVAPDDIDLSSCPRPVPDLFTADVDGEVVVVGGANRVMALNRTAGIVFQLLDGSSTLAELVVDLSEGLGVDPALVQTDVLAFAQELGRRGLLDGVGVVAPAPDQADWARPEPVSIGVELPALELLDLDGVARSLAEFRGRRVLLVNWSPRCGFCTRIATVLADAADGLEAHGITLVFLASGSETDNRPVFAEAGLRAPALLRDGDEIDPFMGTGTPAAYLLDEEGRVAADMVIGADRVPLLVADLAGLTPQLPGDAGGIESGVQYLPAPAAMCGAGGGAGAPSGDAPGTVAYRFGDVHVGLRADAESTAAVLDRLFPGARVIDRRVPDNYSITLAPGAGKGSARSRGLHLLSRGSMQLVRSRSAARVLVGLLAHLSAELVPTAESVVHVHAAAVVYDDTAVLLPRHLADQLPVLQARLNRAGVRVVDAPEALVDLAAAALVVPAPAIPFDQSVIDELDATHPRLGSELPRVEPGRYPLRAWCFARSEGEGGDGRGSVVTPATAVAAALPLLREVAPDALPEAVDALASVFNRIDGHGVCMDDPGKLIVSLADILDAPSAR